MALSRSNDDRSAAIEAWLKVMKSDSLNGLKDRQGRLYLDLAKKKLAGARGNKLPRI